MAASEQKLNKIFDQNVQITGDLTVDGNLVGYSDDNFYLDGITKSGNTLTFSVNGATNQSYTFGSAAFANTADFAAASHTHSYLPLSGGTITGNVTFTGADGENALTLSGSSPTLAFTDVTSSADDFYIHVNSNNFYILRDTGGVGDYGTWNSPHPLQIEADTSRFIVFGNDVITSGNIGSQSVSYASSAGSAGNATEAYALDVADTRAAQRMPTDVPEYRVSAEFTNQIVSGWHSLINVKGWHDGYATWQLIGGSDTSAHNNLYFRSGVGSSWGNLNTIWHSGNDGSGSGLDADNLDGFTWMDSGKSIRGDYVYVGSGGGYFYNDSGSRVRINQDFYTNNSNTYLYANNLYLGDGSGDNIRVRGNRMFGNNWEIDTDGSAGFGTASAGAQVHIVDNSFPQLRINDDTGGGEAGMRIRSFNGTSGLHCDIFSQMESSNETGYLGFRVPWNGYQKLRLHSNGSLSLGIPGNGQNNGGRYLSFEGNADASGEGSGRLFFTEHNSTTASMDNYGMSIGYRGGGTSVTTAGGNTWTGLSQIGNGQWGMWGHNNDLAGSLIMYGDRAATFVDFAGNNIQGVANITATNMNIADGIYHSGDTNTYIQFHAADQWRVVTGGVERLEVNNSNTIFQTSLVIAGGDIRGNGSQLVLNAGESAAYYTGQTGEIVYINAEGGLQVNSSPDNWSSGWAGRKTTTINDTAGDSYFANSITVNGHFYGKSVNGTWSNLYRMGGVYFTWDSDSYGTNFNHSITSTYNGSYGDHITLNSYGNVRINIDSNGNGTNTFEIGRHTTGNANTMLTLNESSELTVNGNVRTPIFYDSNDTNYYVDPNTTATSARFRGKTVYGPNTSWSKYLQVGGNGREYVDNANYASVVTTNGNLHLDAASGYDTYINFYDGGNVRFGGGATAETARIASDGSARFPIYYDYNNTGYYCNPASTSLLSELNVNHFGINNSSSGTRDGISLYGGYSGGEPTYGLLFTGTSLGTHGSVTGSWATYFTMNNDNTRGWIFRRVGSGNCASISGGGTASFNGDVIAYYSDMRLKTKLGDIEDPIGKIQALNGFYYEPNEVAESYGYEKETRVGLSAQEVEAVLPEIVTDAPIGDGYKTVDYAKLVPVLVEAIKEQQKQIDELKSLINKS